MLFDLYVFNINLIQFGTEKDCSKFKERVLTIPMKTINKTYCIYFEQKLKVKLIIVH
jgi:hypothetical protein